MTSIGEQAFDQCKSLTSIIIPDELTSIGWSAFSHCPSLTSVMIAGKQITLPKDGNEDEMIRFICNVDHKTSLKTSIKCSLLSEMIVVGYDTENTIAYLKKNHEELLHDFLRYGNADAFWKLLDTEGIITEENIDTSIEIAAGAGQNENTALLLEYKHRKFGYSDLVEQFTL